MDLDLKFRTKLKYVEELGRTVGQVLINKDPVSLDCGCQGCMSCETQPGRCMRKNAIYRMTCLTCLEEQMTSVYIGETSRT